MRWVRNNFLVIKFSSLSQTHIWNIGGNGYKTNGGYASCKWGHDN